MVSQEQFSTLIDRIEKIEKRNKQVEVNKQWETSPFRKILIAATTYVVLCSFFYTNNDPHPFISAIVPTTGFLLSTLSFSFIKKWWIEKHS